MFALCLVVCLVGLVDSTSEVFSKVRGSFFPAPEYLGLSKFPALNSEAHLSCCDPNSMGQGTHREWSTKGRNVEWDEWVLVEALITPESRVLEFGARYGTTSCVLSRASGNAGHVVSVEVDATVKRYLLANREYYECNFHVFIGSVSEVPLEIEYNLDYATKSRAAAPGSTTALPHIPFHHLQERVGYEFNTLLIDCEGCASHVLTSAILKQVQLVIIEHDGDPNGHPAVFKSFQDHGFECIWKIHDTYDPSQEWSRNLVHSAWRKGGLAVGMKNCSAFKQDRQLSDDLLRCMSIE